MLFKFTLHRFHTYFHVCRFCVHHSHEDRRGLSSAECSHWVRWRCTRPGWTHHICETLVFERKVLSIEMNSNSPTFMLCVKESLIMYSWGSSVCFFFSLCRMGDVPAQVTSPRHLVSLGLHSDLMFLLTFNTNRIVRQKSAQYQIYSEPLPNVVLNQIHIRYLDFWPTSKHLYLIPIGIASHHKAKEMHFHKR